MARFQGIEQAAFYVRDPGSGETASVLFDVLDAGSSGIDLYTPNKGETDSTGGRVYSGEKCSVSIQGLDEDGSKLASLRTWLHANTRVRFMALSSDGATLWNWLEKDRLTEARPVDVSGAHAGRADFVQTGLMRTAEEPNVLAQTNFVSHLTDPSAIGNTDFYFPLPGVKLYASIQASAAGGVLGFRFKDAQGNFLTASHTMENILANRTTELVATTPEDVHEVRINISGSIGTISKLSVRADGSYEYAAH